MFCPEENALKNYIYGFKRDVIMLANYISNGQVNFRKRKAFVVAGKI